MIQNQYFHSTYIQCQVGSVRLQAGQDVLHYLNQLAGTTDPCPTPCLSRNQWLPWSKKHVRHRSLGWPGSSLSEPENVCAYKHPTSVCSVWIVHVCWEVDRMLLYILFKSLNNHWNGAEFGFPEEVRKILAGDWIIMWDIGVKREKKIIKKKVHFILGETM